ncbi:hypothetical protein PLICRDRAFT_612038 [Plicaturopsis crispa FD-325 SS-3]|nr:hypothetical protein PLICRDRAFT_612038 [Plicaturopsis crispa FD-325 SS-3]
MRRALLVMTHSQCNATLLSQATLVHRKLYNSVCAPSCGLASICYFHHSPRAVLLSPADVYPLHPLRSSNVQALRSVRDGSRPIILREGSAADVLLYRLATTRPVVRPAVQFRFPSATIVRGSCTLLTAAVYLGMALDRANLAKGMACAIDSKSKVPSGCLGWQSIPPFILLCIQAL